VVDEEKPEVDSRDDGKHTGRNDVLLLLAFYIPTVSGYVERERYVFGKHLLDKRFLKYLYICSWR